MQILIDRDPDMNRLNKLNVFEWPIWSCDVSEFPWSYDETEQCYLLEGDVDVELDTGETVSFGAGMFVTFPKGLNCRWMVKKPVRKHYEFI